jgi:hypothetical protein
MFIVYLILGLLALGESRKLSVVNVRKILRNDNAFPPIQINHSLVKKYYIWSFRHIDRMQSTHDGTLDRFVEIDLQQRVLCRFIDTMNNLFTRDSIHDYIALQDGCDNIDAKLAYLNKTFGKNKYRDEFLLCIRDLYRITRIVFSDKNNYTRTRNWLAKYIENRSC